MITVTPGSIVRLADAIDFHLPHGWRDDMAQKVVDEAPKRIDQMIAVKEELRDRFAMAALQGLLHDTDERDRQHAPIAHQTPLFIAREAYALADAMLDIRIETRAAKPEEGRDAR